MDQNSEDPQRLDAFDFMRLNNEKFLRGFGFTYAPGEDVFSPSEIGGFAPSAEEYADFTEISNWNGENLTEEEEHEIEIAWLMKIAAIEEREESEKTDLLEHKNKESQPEERVKETNMADVLGKVSSVENELSRLQTRISSSILPLTQELEQSQGSLKEDVDSLRLSVDCNSKRGLITKGRVDKLEKEFKLSKEEIRQVQLDCTNELKALKVGVDSLITRFIRETWELGAHSSCKFDAPISLNSKDFVTEEDKENFGEDLYDFIIRACMSFQSETIQNLVKNEVESATSEISNIFPTTRDLDVLKANIDIVKRSLKAERIYASDLENTKTIILNAIEKENKVLTGKVFSLEKEIKELKEKISLIEEQNEDRKSIGGIVVAIVIIAVIIWLVASGVHN